MKLQAAVERFAALTQSISDEDLERPWTWGDYDEGVRFAFFRTYEELRDLAAQIGAARLNAAIPPTPAQQIVGQYLAAFWDLKAALLGVDDALALRAPAEREWPLRTVLVHILEAESSFFTVLVYAVERERSQDGRPLAISDAAWDAFWAGDPLEGLKQAGTYSELMAYFEGLHRRVTAAFADLSEAELEAPSVFWESTPMPVRFRLHRLDSHMRQHTIQMDKARLQMGLPPPEAQRLLRLIFTALADVQAMRLGAGDVGLTEADNLAQEIQRRVEEIEAVLKGAVDAGPPG